MQDAAGQFEVYQYSASRTPSSVRRWALSALPGLSMALLRTRRAVPAPPAVHRPHSSSKQWRRWELRASQHRARPHGQRKLPQPTF